MVIFLDDILKILELMASVLREYEQMSIEALAQFRRAIVSVL